MTDKDPEISVIIPVYNTEQYLRQCLDSIVYQTFSDIEIICFNDASTDGSLAILREYEVKDRRIKVIDSKVNIRQGGGRNAGLRIARGKYISFVDSDDWIELTFLQELYEAILRESADISICDYFSSKNEKLTYISHIGNTKGLSQKEIKIRIIDNGTQLPETLFKKEIFFKNDLFFPENMIYEDNAIGTALYLSAEKIVKIDRPLYYYRQDNSSTTRTKNNYRLFDRLDTAVMLYENIKRLGKYKEFEDNVDKRFVFLFYTQTIGGILNNFDPVPLDKLKHVQREVYNYIPKEKFKKIIKQFPIRNRFVLTCAKYCPRILVKIKKIFGK